jgi:Arc/MetJ family transcription regulator
LAGLATGENVYYVVYSYTQMKCRPMRTNIDIDDTLMAEAQKVSGQPTKKQTVEEALRLMIRLRQQADVRSAFGKYRWRGNLRASQSRH